MANLEPLIQSIPVAPLKLALHWKDAELLQIRSTTIWYPSVTTRRPMQDRLTVCRVTVQDSYLLECECPRFGSGEGKGVLKESVRGCDLFIMVDVCKLQPDLSVSVAMRITCLRTITIRI